MISKPLRIIFMGTPDFAVPSLRSLVNGPDQVVAVVCQPDRKKGRGKKLSAPPVKIMAMERHIPVLQPASIRTDEVFDRIKALRPDLIVVAAYGKILPGSLLDLPPFGAINVHGSLLPKYRGAAPIQWAIINGETKTGVTIMQMDEGMDTGDILHSVSLPIGDEDTAGSLFAKLAELGSATLTEAVSRLKKGRLRATKQDAASATSASMLTKEQGHLDWFGSARALHCLIRGLDPWPSAYSFLEGKRFRFFKPLVIEGPVTERPGTLCRADKDGLLIATGKNYLLVREIQPEGKKRMDVQSCLCGTKLPVGKQFNSSLDI